MMCQSRRGRWKLVALMVQDVAGTILGTNKNAVTQAPPPFRSVCTTETSRV